MDRKTIIKLLIGQEIFLIFISLFWLSIKNHDFSFFYLPSMITVEPFKSMIISKETFLYGLLAGVFLLISSNIIVLTSPPFKKSLKILDEMLLNKLKPIDFISLAFFSGLAEEIFFRGILQNGIGIIPASIIFALLHFPSKEFAIYALWTFFAGMFFGNIYQITNNLFIVIVAHILNNLLALVFWKKLKKYFTDA